MRREVRGSLTVFLALLMTLFLAFSGVCLEYARAQAVSSRVQAGAAAAVESVFAGYHAPLFARYQLMCRLIPDGDFDELSVEALRYAGGTSDSARGGSSLDYQAQEAGWQQVVFITDENGAVFAEMAAAAMKASAITIAAGVWRDHLELSGEKGGEAEDVLAENGGKESLTAADALKGYDDWKKDAEEARDDAQEEEAEAEADAEGERQEAPEPEMSGPTEKGKKFLDLLETLKKTFSHGILGLVVPEGTAISSGKLSSAGLPSSLPASVKNRRVREHSSSVTDGILLREYFMRNMDCFTSQAEKPFAYELEYLLAGKSSDEANLKSVVSRLFWIRMGMNLLYLSQSKTKQEEAREAATLAVGWLGQPLLTEGLTGILLSAWAAAEGLSDVRELLKGEKVPLAKTDSSWKLSLEKSGDDWQKEPKQEEDAEAKGLAYEDYLRLCLSLVSQETLCYRGMDVVQENIQRLDGGFQMSDCMVAAKLTLRAQAKPLFTPLYGNRGSGSSRMRLCFEKESDFSYLNDS